MSSIGAEAMLVPGQLPDMRPTDREIALIQGFPDDSPILHEWLGTDGGRINVVPAAEGSEHYGDATFYEGHIVAPDATVTKHFEYRAQMAGPASRGVFRALGWLMNENYEPRGWLSGRIIPEQTDAQR